MPAAKGKQEQWLKFINIRSWGLLGLIGFSGLFTGCTSLPALKTSNLAYGDPLMAYRLLLEPQFHPKPYNIKHRCDIYGSYSKFNINGETRLKVDALNMLGTENNIYHKNASALFDKLLSSYLNLYHTKATINYRLNMINRFGNTLFAEVLEKGKGPTPKRTAYLITKNNDIVYVLQTPVVNQDLIEAKRQLSQVLSAMRVPNAPETKTSILSTNINAAFINPSTASARVIKDWLGKYGCT